MKSALSLMLAYLIFMIGPIGDAQALAQDSLGLKTRDGQLISQAAPLTSVQQQPYNPYGAAPEFTENFRITNPQAPAGAVDIRTPIPAPLVPLDFLKDDLDGIQAGLRKAACFYMNGQFDALKDLEKLSERYDWTLEKHKAMWSFWMEAGAGKAECSDPDHRIKDLPIEVEPSFTQDKITGQFQGHDHQILDRTFVQTSRKIIFKKIDRALMGQYRFAAPWKTKEELVERAKRPDVQAALRALPKEMPNFISAQQVEELIGKLTTGDFVVESYPENKEFQFSRINFGRNPDAKKYPNGIAGQNMYYPDEILKEYSFAKVTLSSGISGVNLIVGIFGDCTNLNIPAFDLIPGVEILPPPAPITPAATPVVPATPVPAPTPTGNQLVPGLVPLPGPAPTPKSGPCQAVDEETGRPPLDSDLAAGGTFRLHPWGEWRFRSGQLYVMHKKHGEWVAENDPFRSMVPMDHDKTGRVEGVPKNTGMYLVKYLVYNTTDNQVTTCEELLPVKGGGKKLLVVGIVIGFAGGVAFCLATKLCGGGHGIPPFLPKTANDGSGGTPPGRGGRR